MVLRVRRRSLRFMIAFVQEGSLPRRRQNRNRPGLVVYFTKGGLQAPADRS
jgi:hypothetical protein